MAQRVSTHALCVARGYRHDVDNDHFEDVGISGYDPNAYRPGFEALMDAVRAERYDVVVIPALSRLTRRGALEAMRIEAEMRKHGVTLVSVHEPYLDTSDPVGVGIFAIIAGLAEQESATKSMFITNTKEVHAKAGGHVSGIAPYGFDSERVQRDGLTLSQLVPNGEESPEVLRMVEWTEQGKSATAITGILNAEDVPTKAENMGEKGKTRIAARRKRATKQHEGEAKWHSATVLKILRDPRLAGFAMETVGRKKPNKETGEPGSAGKREILRDEDGQPVISHKGIITPERWYKLQDKLDGRTPTYNRGKGDPTLLGGWNVLRCGVCEGNLYPERSRGLYMCNVQNGAVPGHGGLSIMQEPADDITARLVWARLMNLDPSDAEDIDVLTEASRRFAFQQDTAGVEAERIATEAALTHTRESMRTLYRDRREGAYKGVIGTEMFHESLERLEGQEERCTARLTELTAIMERSTVLPVNDWLGGLDADSDPIGPETLWDRWTLMERREFLSLFVERIDVAPSIGRGRHAKTDKRLTVTWVSHKRHEEEKRKREAAQNAM
jgi:DNA invertase Pin-like site-specific DNA recombinase